ncbi:MAG: hypothetical protein D6786_03480 [Gammaproteobacteria bacterium]|nr:MAG: hypothetical protein D6786_03480 [Gammaproteobacteria bacterium]
MQGQRGRHEQARECFRRALERAPDDPLLLANLGIACEALGETEPALRAYDRALEHDRCCRPARLNRARLRLRAGDLAGAREDCEVLLAASPDDVEARFSRAEVALAAGGFDSAIDDCRRVLEQDPAHGGALLDLGVAMAALGRLEGAQAIFDQLRDNPPSALARWRLPGEEAPPALERLDARAIFLNRSWQRLIRADWRDRERLTAMARRLAAEEPTPALAEPAVAFPLLSLDLRPAVLRVWLRRVSAALEEQAPSPAASPPVCRSLRGRIRLGYLSAHFGRHPNSLNMGAVYSAHDRGRFEVVGLSLRPDDGSRWYRWIRNECDQFFNLHALDSEQAARRIRELGVDLLVDLDGYTTGARPEILARRPAPLQLSYLGFPAAIPAAFYDYDICSRAAEHGPWQGDPACPIWLPHTHFPFDERNLPARPSTRAAEGLPEGAIVFCCFCNTYKIEPEVFGRWMQILAGVPDGVLWLLQRSGEASGRLRRAAAEHGIDPGRLLFAPHTEVDEHLARYPLADLFLDTFCYNAHTTAQEALYSGLPVLTSPGATRAARIGASLVRAAGLPELVCRSHEEYRDRAIELGRDRDALRGLKEKLRRNRERAPLFDVAGRIRDLERAYETAWRRHLRGLPPAPIDLSAGTA